MGNVYLAGSFANAVALGGTTLTSFGDRDVFVAKFNPASNQFVWAQRAGGTGYDVAYALAVSGTNVYVAGHFDSPTANFGPTTLTNVGTNTSTDVFVAKLTDMGSTGSFAWAQRAGGTGYDSATALAVSGVSVYVAGLFSSPTASFGPTNLTNLGFTNTFVAKLTDAGSTSGFVWAQRAGGLGYNVAYNLTVSGTSVYVAGAFNDSGASFGATTLATAGGFDLFVAKLTDAGTVGSFAWAQRAGGTGDDIAYTLAVSGTNVYVAGIFDSPTAGFGATNLINLGFSDVFVTKLTDAGGTGSFAWAAQAGGTGDDRAYTLVLSGANLYVAGAFSSPTTNFGSATLTNSVSTGTYDIFVAKLTDSGNAGSFAWAQRAGGTAQDGASVLALSGTSVYVAGTFEGPTAGFGATTLTNPTLNRPLGFLASLTDPTLTATTPTAGPREPASLFPNPARHTATLRWPAGTAPAPLTLTDALGRAVRRYPAPAGPEAALDLRGLPAGLYLLRGAGPAQRLAVE